MKIWTLQEAKQLYHQPLLELVSQAHNVHEQHFPIGEVQLCSLISIKTGGCPENCHYCPQSSRYSTYVKAEPMLSYETVLARARCAVAKGASRICLGAAWRHVRSSPSFDVVLQMVRGIAALGVEVCCTLGMLSKKQAEELKGAGLYAYNHNLDSSERFYKTIITTRTYQERLQTLDAVQKAGLSLCSGGIIGMGETVEDRLELLVTLSRHNPDSVPINRLEPIAGTPLEHEGNISSWEMIRMVAVARILMPRAFIRLSAGRIRFSMESQALSFLAGANSIFVGTKLLTAPNTSEAQDEEMFKILGLYAKKPSN